MRNNISIAAAAVADAPEVAAMVGELLAEIMQAIGEQSFHFDLADTSARLADFIANARYFVFLARDAERQALGFITLYEGYALYAEGALGTIPEFYVRPACRAQKIGLRLLASARDFGATRGWKRLEVTTPPLPQFARTLAFYQREGFAITGGRKLKALL